MALLLVCSFFVAVSAATPEPLTTAAAQNNLRESLNTVVPALLASSEAAFIATETTPPAQRKRRTLFAGHRAVAPRRVLKADAMFCSITVDAVLVCFDNVDPESVLFDEASECTTTAGLVSCTRALTAASDSITPPDVDDLSED